MKIVVNRCFGGFGLSEEACKELGCVDRGYDIRRDDPRLVEVVERLGDRANGAFSELEVVEIPDGVDWFIDDYDGQETIHERHRSW